MSWLSTRLFRLGRIARNTSGIAAIEFAFVGSVLVLVYLGVVSMFTAVQGNQQMARTAVTISDLATRVIELNDDKRDGLFATAESLMSRWQSPSTYSVSITSIVNPPDKDEKNPVDAAVAWSEATEKGAVITTKDLKNYDIPEISEGESLILVVVSGKFVPSFSSVGVPATISMSESSVRRPRFVSEVIYYDKKGKPLDWLVDHL